MPMNKVIINTQHLAEIMIDYVKFPEKVTEHSINSRKKIEKDYNWDDRDSSILDLFDLSQLINIPKFPLVNKNHKISC